MHRLIAASLLCALSLAGASQRASGATVPTSLDKPKHVYTNMLLAVQLEHSPEEGTQEGVSNSTPASPIRPSRSTRQRRELEAVLAKLKPARPRSRTRTSRRSRHSLKAFDLQFREEDFDLQHECLPQRQRDRFPGTARSARRSGGGGPAAGGTRAAAQICGYRSRP